MNIIDYLKKYWWLIALVAIFIFSYHIRAINLVEDRILSFDPTFQYRFTKYFVDWGFWPAWDELTYHVGRPIGAELLGPLMSYLTAIMFWLVKPFGVTLKTTCSYAAAIYGAIIVFPAFALGKELSNKYGGLMAAILAGTAPQILVRTFGSSYDTDQLALFFILLTLYLGLMLLKKKDIKSFVYAFTGFTAFTLAWGLFIYSYAIVAISAAVLFIITLLSTKKEIIKEGMELAVSQKNKFKKAFGTFKNDFIIMVGLIAAVFAGGLLLKSEPWLSIPSIVGFALTPEAWIVNISIAELQPFNIFDISGWMTSFGRFVSGFAPLDNTLFIIFISLLGIGAYYTFKDEDKRNLSFILTLLILGVYTTVRGVRFTEFTSALFVVLVGTGFGHLVNYCRRDEFLKIFAIGLGLSVVFIVAGISMQLGNQLGPDMDPNWDATWNFIRTQTPELSIVGTWWDPGHMISDLGERRNFADGAHCPEPCLYNINDRITDLGTIMATTDESVSLNLINKYRGTSTNVYWIASADLIGKYQWLQYFGTGCDARVNPNCQLYSQIPRSDVKYDVNGNLQSFHYQNIIIMAQAVPFPVLVQGKDAAIVSEIIYYNQAGEVQYIDFSNEEMIETAKGLESILNVNMADSAVPLTIWLSKDYSNIVIIPETLRDTIFTKMFFLEGQGLEHFKQVFRNEYVKIYEVV